MNNGEKAPARVMSNVVVARTMACDTDTAHEIVI